MNRGVASPASATGGAPRRFLRFTRALSPLWAVLLLLGSSVAAAACTPVAEAPSPTGETVAPAADWTTAFPAEVPVIVDPGTACQGDVPFAQAQVAGLPRLWLEVAATPEERARGLMYRETLDPDAAMLFIFETESRGGFWMRNTPLPLSIAWLDAEGTIVDIQDMQPLSDQVHAPPAPYWFAVETNQGWFAANGVAVGDRLVLCLPPPASTEQPQAGSS